MRPYYVIAGLGRCGTDLIFDATRTAVHNAYGNAHGGFKRCISIKGDQPSSQLCSHRPGYVYKTHDYPQGVESHINGKFIFMFGDPIDLVLSAQHKTNTEEHYLNLRVDPRRANTKDYLTEDTMRLEDMFNDWCKLRTPNVLRVRYETMWENLDKINDFLGIEIELPPKRARTTSRVDYPVEDIIKMEKTYHNLIILINESPDIF